MRFIRPLCLMLLGWLAACQPEKQAVQESKFFPVVDFIKSQVHEVDSLRLPLSKFTTRGSGRADSVSIQPAEFSALARAFMDPDLNDPLLKPQYTETSFADQTIAGITFTYSTVNKTLPLQRLDVIIHPDPELSDRVKSVYLEKNYLSGDTAVLEKLYWKADRNFQLISIRQYGSQKPETMVTKVVWRPDDQQN